MKKKNRSMKVSKGTSLAHGPLLYVNFLYQVDDSNVRSFKVVIPQEELVGMSERNSRHSEEGIKINFHKEVICQLGKSPSDYQSLSMALFNYLSCFEPLHDALTRLHQSFGCVLTISSSTPSESSLKISDLGSWKKMCKVIDETYNINYKRVAV